MRSFFIYYFIMPSLFILLQYLLFIDPTIGLMPNLTTPHCLIFNAHNNIIDCNTVCNGSTPTNDEIQDVIDYFNDRPFEWAVDTNDLEIQSILELNNLQRQARLDLQSKSMMLLNIVEPPEEATYKEGVSVQEIDIENNEIVMQWATIVSKVFRKTNAMELFNFIQQLKTNITTSNCLKLYLGYYNDQPVSTCMTMKHDDIVSLHWIGTLPRFRKKGLGFATIHKSLFNAKYNGCTHALLMPYSLGESVYQRMGFVIQSRYYFYQKAQDIKKIVHKK